MRKLLNHSIVLKNIVFSVGILFSMSLQSCSDPVHPDSERLCRCYTQQFRADSARVDVIGDDADDVDVEVEDFDFSMEYQINDDLGDESILMQIGILALVVLIIYGAVKMGRNNKSAKF